MRDNQIQLNKVLKQTFSKFNYPNHGGCGKFAYAIARALDSVGIDNEIYLFCWDQNSLEDFIQTEGKLKRDISKPIINWINNGKRSDSIHNHLAVRVGNKFYDAQGEFKPEGKRFKISIKAVKLLIEKAGWNWRFAENNPPSRSKLKYINSFTERKLIPVLTYKGIVQ